MTDHSSKRAAKRWNTYDGFDSSPNCCRVDKPCARHAIPNRVAAFAAIEDALRLALHALESHDQWCGHNPDAPGDSSYNRAIEAIQAILDTEASGYA